MMESDRRFGVEIEFKSPFGHFDKETVADKLIELGIDVSLRRATGKWHIIIDSSCGLELVSPILQGEDGLFDVLLVCNALRMIGATVDSTCGLHVHLDAGDFKLDDFKNLIKYFLKFEDVFDAIQPTSRRGSNNGYCRSNLSRYADCNERWFDGAEQHMNVLKSAYKSIDSAEALADLRFNSRYYKLNLDSYWEHGTVEVRHHEGTLNGEDIINWIKLLQKLFTRAKSVREVKLKTESAYKRAGGFGIERMDSMFITLRATDDKEVTQHFRKRARRLNPAGEGKTR